MDCQHSLSNAGRSAGAATRRLISRLLVVAVAASVLGLLPGVQSLAPASPAVVQAAEPDYPDTAPSASGRPDSGPPTSSRPRHDPLDEAVQSTGAPDEQLDIAAALDQGTRLFLLRARYDNLDNAQADYYLAGPQGVSHQPLGPLFAPLGAWLATPGHEHELVRLGLQTDPRSANPARFDAACQAFTTALGAYLLKASDLPEGKALNELTLDELATLRAQPRVATDWSACTGDELPIVRPPAAPVAATGGNVTWMNDLASVIGPRPLRQVVIPGSHDAATYGEWPPIVQDFTQTQSMDIRSQLNYGSRYFDLRFACLSNDEESPNCQGQSTDDYYVNHGSIYSTLQMSTVLGDLFAWVDQPGHEKEIVVLDIAITANNGNADVLNSICTTYLGPELTAGRVLQPSMVPSTTTLYDMSLNQIWALPGQPRIIVKGWDDCTGQSWPPAPPPGTAATPLAGYYADQCTADWVAASLAASLTNRTDDSGQYPGNGQVVTGLYALDIQATPEFSTEDCQKSVYDLAPQQWPVLQAIQEWWQQDQNHARANLNIIAGDYLGPNSEKGVTWPIVQTAVTLNQNAQAPQIDVVSDPNANSPVAVKCSSPGQTSPTLVVYPATEGFQSPNAKTFTAAPGATRVQGSLSVADFPTAVSTAGGSYLDADCSLDNGSAGLLGQTSRINIPLTAFPTPVGLKDAGMEADYQHERLLCVAPSTVKGPVTITAYPTSEGPNGAHHVSASAGQPDPNYGNYVLNLSVWWRDFPAGGVPLTVTCATSDSPSLTAAPLTLNACQLPRAACVQVADAGSPDNGGHEALVCTAPAAAKSPMTITAYPQAEGPNGPHQRTASGPIALLGNGTDGLILLVTRSDFPAGDYQIWVTCATSDSPPLQAVTTVPSGLIAGPILGLDYVAGSGTAQCTITGFLAAVKGPVTITAYPTSEGPNGPHHQSASGQPDPHHKDTFGLGLALPRSDFPDGDVTVNCASSDSPPWSAPQLTLNTSQLPLLTIRTSQDYLWLYCDRSGSLTSAATLSLAAQTPNAPKPLSVTGTGNSSRGTITLHVPADYFPAGNYKLVANCVSSDTPPFEARSLTLSSSQIPTGAATAAPSGAAAIGTATAVATPRPTDTVRPTNTPTDTPTAGTG
ncbi:MAG: hypothetical protein JOY61_12250 [Chloroflexi bacterium]|nr:hypothetical protein [Chloroflexota bacterium]